MDAMALPESFPGAIITFPMLGEGFSLNPSGTYTIFGHTLYWYGAIIGLGFLLGVIYCFLRGPRDFGVSTDTLTDAVLIGLPAALVGARLFYVFGHWSQYVGATVGETLWNWCRIWEGGSAIPGGLLLVLLLIWLYARRKKIPFGAIMDTACFGLMIGQIIGRWSNFMNREYIGVPTEIFCRMGLTTGGVTYYVHPLFLYESLWMLTGFLFLHIWSKKGRRRYDGQVLLLYLFWYGLIRVLLEFLRTSPLLIPGTGLRASQVLMGAMCAVSAVLLIRNGRRPRDPAELWVNRCRNAKAAEEAEAKEKES